MWTVTILVVTTCVIFVMLNKIFAGLEYFTSLIKIVLFMPIILISLAIVSGAGPGGYVHDGLTWTDFPPFKKGFSGFARAALFATWAVGDQISIGIMGGEAQNPRFSMGHAPKLVPYRGEPTTTASNFFQYTIGIILIFALTLGHKHRLPDALAEPRNRGLHDGDEGS